MNRLGLSKSSAASWNVSMSKWNNVQLGDLCDAKRGITYGIVKVGDYIPGGVPVIRGGDIRDNKIVFDDGKRVSPEVSNQFRRTILQGGEIILNLIAEPGHSAVVPAAMAGFNVSRDVAMIPLSGDVNHRFVNYFLKSPGAVSWLEARLNGSVTRKINLGVLREVPVPLPPRPHQDGVAEVLSALDDKIAVDDRIAARCNELADVYFQAAVEEAPEAPLSKLVDPILGGTPDRSVADYWGEGNPWASAKDITGAPFGIVVSTEEEITHYAVTETKAKPVPKGSVILTARGTVGAIARVGQATSFNQSCYAFTTGRLPAAVLYLTLKSAAQRMLAVAHGTVFSTVTMKTFDHIYIPVLSHSELQYLESRVAPLLDTVERQVRESLSLAELRDTLLPKLMSGEIRVRDAEKVIEDVT
jgi:type I restriction enzyme, S subunit